MRYEHILNSALSTPWAMSEPQLTTLAGVLVRRAMLGEPLDVQAFDSEPLNVEALDRGAAVMMGDVAVLPLQGVIFPKANMVTAMSGGTSAEQFARRFSELMDNADVKAVLIDVDSPGGSVAGIPEAAQVLANARGRKPVVAQVNHLMASAAYYLGSQADEIVISPSGTTGSIGVVLVHEAIGRMLEEQGIDITYIFAGKYKVEGNEVAALSAEAEANLQAVVDTYYGDFVSAVARGRGITPAVVRADYGQGRMMLARQAVTAGVADRIATLDQTLARLRSAQGRAAVGQRRARVEAFGNDPLTEALIEAGKQVAQRGAFSPLFEGRTPWRRNEEDDGLEALAAGVLEETS